MPSEMPLPLYLSLFDLKVLSNDQAPHPISVMTSLFESLSTGCCKFSG